MITPVKIMLCGCNGKMGQVIAQLCEEDDDVEIVCGIDKNTEERNGFPVFADGLAFTGAADVIVDFSHPDSLAGLLRLSKERHLPLVVATTGLNLAQKESLREVAGQSPIFFSANMSLGVNLMLELCQKATRVLGAPFDIEIIEKHHNQKIDAPSGTALALADAISEAKDGPAQYVYDRHSVRKKRGADEIGIHAVRGGNIVGEHTVLFAGQDEVIEITHRATSKEIFARGAIYDMKQLVAAK